MGHSPTLPECLTLANELVWDSQRDGEQTYRRATVCARALGAPSLEISTTSVVNIKTSDLRKAQKRLLGEGLSPSSVNRHIAALMSCLRIASEEGLIDTIPKAPRRLSEPKGRDRIPTRDEIAALAKQLGPTERRMLVVLRRSGLRLGELLKVSPTHIDCEKQSLYLPSNITKNGWSRLVPLDVVAYNTFCRLPSLPPVSSFSRRWREAREKANLGNWFTPHTLRHRRASELAEAGVPIPVVAATLGHRDFRTTERYIHASNEGWTDEMRQQLQQAESRIRGLK